MRVKLLESTMPEDQPGLHLGPKGTRGGQTNSRINSKVAPKGSRGPGFQGRMRKWASCWMTPNNSNHHRARWGSKRHEMQFKRLHHKYHTKTSKSHHTKGHWPTPRAKNLQNKGPSNLKFKFKSFEKFFIKFLFNVFVLIFILLFLKRGRKYRKEPKVDHFTALFCTFLSSDDSHWCWSQSYYSHWWRNSKPSMTHVTLP